jgi:hypothetical protein
VPGEGDQLLDFVQFSPMFPFQFTLDTASKNHERICSTTHPRLSSSSTATTEQIAKKADDSIRAKTISKNPVKAFVSRYKTV